jgi:hypothetical protein
MRRSPPEQGALRTTGVQWVIATCAACALGCVMAAMQPRGARAAEYPHPERAHVLHPPQWYEQYRTHEQSRSPADLGSDVAQSAIGSVSTNNVTYQGGSVMLTDAAYAIYWAPAPHSIPSTYQSLIDRWFSDVGGTLLYNILTQYYEGNPPAYIHNVATFAGSWVDTANPYPHAGTGADPLSDGDIQAEVERAIAANGWPNGGLNATFFVFTAKGVESCAGPTQCTIGTAYPTYCAYHSGFFASFSDVIIYANMPYAGTWSSGFDYTCGVVSLSPNLDADADEEISLVAHEQFESVSDPLGDAWYDAADDEIADKCAYNFGTIASNGSNVTLNGDPYLVQRMWSNAVSACALSYGSVPTPPTPTATKTRTATRTATNTPTAVKTNTPTPTASNTRTPTSTAQPTATIPATATATHSTPPNNACANAMTILVTPYSSTVTTRPATTEPSDPTPPCGNGSRAKSAWWKFTAPRSGVLKANTSGSGYDTILSVYTGSCGAFTPVPAGCNDNASVSTTQSAVAFNAVVGKTYYFMVTATNADGGPTTIQVTY